MSDIRKRRAGLETVSPVVPVQTTYYVPQRDVDKSPILQCINLGISFGGLKAVEDFNLTLGRTEIAGLIGPNGATSPSAAPRSQASSAPTARARPRSSTF